MKIIKTIFASFAALTIILCATTPALAQGLEIPANPTEEYSCAGKSADACLKENPIVRWINFFVNLLSVVVFVGATAMLVYGAIRYVSAGDSPQQVQEAKKLIASVLFGLVAYFFLYAFMQWLIPGGIF